MAYDRYAVAAAVTEQMSFKDAMRHKEVVLEVAALSFAENKRPFLSVLYDELARSRQTFVVLSSGLHHYYIEQEKMGRRHG